MTNTTTHRKNLLIVNQVSSSLRSGVCGSSWSEGVLRCTRGLGTTHLAWSFSRLVKHKLFLSERHLLSTHLLYQSSEKLALEKMPGH